MSLSLRFHSYCADFFDRYIGTFFHGITSTAVFCTSTRPYLCDAFRSSGSIDYLPVYFQACKGASPIRSSVDILPITLVIAPFAFTAGTLIQITQKYRWASVVAWSISLIGFGLLCIFLPCFNYLVDAYLPM